MSKYKEGRKGNVEQTGMESESVRAMSERREVMNDKREK